VNARFIWSTVILKVPINADYGFWQRWSYDWTVDGAAYEFSVARFGGKGADWWFPNFAMEIN